MSEESRKWHDYYEESLTSIERKAVDASYKEVTENFLMRGIRVCGDDRAEELIAAITKYLFECKAK